jgi:hypothetical protein
VDDATGGVGKVAAAKQVLQDMEDILEHRGFRFKETVMSGVPLTLIRAAMKIDVAVRLEVIYDFSATNRREGRRYVMPRP